MVPALVTNDLQPAVDMLGDGAMLVLAKKVAAYMGKPDHHSVPPTTSRSFIGG
jgi:hypothetical protein